MNFNTFQEKLLEFFSEDPNFCAYMGLDKNLNDLPNPGKNKRITNQGKLKMLKNTLASIDQSQLSEDEKIDYKLCEYLLEQTRLSTELVIDDVPRDMKLPNAIDMITGPLFMFFINDEREEKYRIVNIVSRLQKVPEFLRSYQKNIYEPVQRWVEIELQKLQDFPAFLENILNWTKESQFKNTGILEKAITDSSIAVKKYEEFLKNVSITQNICLGSDQLTQVLQSRGIDLTPDELHIVAKKFIQENLESIENLRLKLCAKYELKSDTTSEELKVFLDKKYAIKKNGVGFQFVLERYESEKNKVRDYIKERDLFPIMDDQEMKIIQTPKFMEPSIPAGAMMPPLPLRGGIKKSLVYLTLSEDLLAEHTEISIPGMMIHEGIPGHHLQFAWAANNQSVIRKIASFNDLSEGWTTMLEDYMLDIGYAGDLTDEMRFSGKKDISRIGARVAIDLYFMSGDKKYLDLGLDCKFDSDDVFVNAGNLLKKLTGFVDQRVQAELNWYSQECGYPLSYLTGNHLVWSLKSELREKNMDLNEIEFDQKFHKKFLAAGNMPMSLLRTIMLNSW